MKSICAAMLILFVTTVAASAVENKTITLVFGLYSNDKPSKLIKQFKPTINALERNIEEELGHNVTIDIKITKTYNNAIDLLADGTFDFVRFGPVSYIRAFERNNDIQLIAMESINGKNVNYGVIVVEEDSEIVDISDLKFSRFAFGNKNSTIGRYLPQQFLLENDINENMLKKYDYLRRHDLVGKAVADGSYDAGSLREITFLELQKNGYPLREIARFPNVSKPWIASARLSSKMYNIIQEGLLLIDDTELLSKLNIDGFEKGDNSAYDSLRVAIEHNKDFFPTDDNDHDY